MRWLTVLAMGCAAPTDWWLSRPVDLAEFGLGCKTDPGPFDWRVGTGDGALLVSVSDVPLECEQDLRARVRRRGEDLEILLVAVGFIDPDEPCACYRDYSLQTPRPEDLGEVRLFFFDGQDTRQLGEM
ncbi:MAG: hypothetical protein AAF211_02955 [Myxococcota bacterium]